MNLIKDLQWRGLVQDIIPGTEENLTKEENIKVYIGFDPTSDSLHVGSLLPIILLTHLQRAGHTPIALVGGATGMVGDPSGKQAERQLLDIDKLRKNQTSIQKQLEYFLDFSTSRKNAAIIVNNYDWFKDINFLEFIRDVGKHLTINYMMAKDTVKKRILENQGISFAEFSYQLVQAYDFYWLYTEKQCVMQMGGSDQWGNITAGTELIRKKASGEAFAFTCPLVTKTDGTKFGKSEGGNIWLDPKRTSPYQFYQFWINASDEDAKDWLKKFTFLSQEEVSCLIIQSEKEPKKRIVQKALAKHVTQWVHGQDAYHQAIKASEALFGDGASVNAIQELSHEMFQQALDGIPIHQIARQEIHNHILAVDLLVSSEITKSKGEARKLIESGGLYINKEKEIDAQRKITERDVLFKRFILINRGKKNYFLFELV